MFAFDEGILVYGFTNSIGQDLGFDLVVGSYETNWPKFLIVFAPLLFGMRVIHVTLRPLEVFSLEWKSIDSASSLPLPCPNSYGKIPLRSCPARELCQEPLRKPLV